jgi:1,2-phenylacetyl-CoA epoxidase catalytic subunit
MNKEFCTDETCPFSDWPQNVELLDLHEMSTSQVEAKYGIKKRRPNET